MINAKLAVVAGALLFSTGGVAIKLSTLTGWQVSCLRSLIAAVVLILLVPGLRTAWTWRAALVAIPYATTFTLYTLANKLTTAASAIFLQDTAPLYVLLLGPLLLRERTRPADIAFMVALVLGLGLILGGSAVPSATATDPGLGNALGLCSGVSWALTVLGLRWLAVRSTARSEHPITAIIVGCTLASAIGAMFSFPFTELDTTNWLIVAYLGLFQIGLAYVLVTHGIKHVTALQASLLLLVEPVFAPVWAWIFLGELPAALALAGGAIVILATLVYALRDSREDPAS